MLERRTAYDYSEIEYPDDCIVDFDMRLIDLFRGNGQKSHCLFRKELNRNIIA